MDRPLWRPFPLIASHSQPLQEEYLYIQLVRRSPLLMTKHWQKFHGTKLAQSGTKTRLSARDLFTPSAPVHHAQGLRSPPRRSQLQRGGADFDSAIPRFESWRP